MRIEFEKSFPTLVGLYSSHTEYSCAFCNNIYQTKADRLKHLKRTHAENCCSHCDEFFEDKNELESHTRYSHADKRISEVSGLSKSAEMSFPELKSRFRIPT